MGRKPKTTIWSLKDEEEAAVKLEQETKEEFMEETTQNETTVNPHHVKMAYSLIENEGKYHVISVEFDPNNLTSGKVKKIESNTDKYLMQERLQVLLMGDDLI